MSQTLSHRERDVLYCECEQMFVSLVRKFAKKEATMEDRSLIAKTLLKCYPHLDDLYDALKECVEDCVQNGFYAIFPSEQMRLYERIYAYERRKIGVYNMKYLVEEAFRRGKGAALSLLKERYLSHQGMNDLTLKYQVSLRTCYRYIKKGFVELASEMEKLGFDKKKILTEYGDEPLFLAMLNRVIKEDDAENEEREAQKEGDLNSRRLPPLCRLYCERTFSADGRAQRG